MSILVIVLLCLLGAVFLIGIMGMTQMFRRQRSAVQPANWRISPFKGWIWPSNGHKTKLYRHTSSPLFISSHTSSCLATRPPWHRVFLSQHITPRTTIKFSKITRSSPFGSSKTTCGTTGSPLCRCPLDFELSTSTSTQRTIQSTLATEIFGKRSSHASLSLTILFSTDSFPLRTSTSLSILLA